jgi:hypothetical protein
MFSTVFRRREFHARATHRKKCEDMNKSKSVSRKSNGTLKVWVERESVCAGDDVWAPHRKRFMLKRDISLAQALQVITARYLPTAIQGGKATWLAMGNRPLAVFAQQWKQPKLLVDGETPLATLIRQEDPQLWFRYFHQEPPMTAYWRAKRGQLSQAEIEWRFANPSERGNKIGSGQ